MANSNGWRCLVVISACLAMPGVCAAQRDVQISSILFNDGDAIIEGFELTNFGTSVADMSNWQYCSHDENEVRVYGVVGGMIGPGETQMFFARDFRLATPFTPEAYSLAIFDLNAGGFGGTDNIVDHLQWSIDGEHDTSAAFRSQQAVNGGVWTEADAWIATTADTSRIVLRESSHGAVLHGPDDYETFVAPPFGPPCDFNGDGNCNSVDLDFLTTSDATPESIGEWLTQASDFDPDSRTFLVGDVDLSGEISSADLGLLLNNFGSDDGPVYSQGNLNGDAVVDSSDLGLLLNNFGFESASSAAVPEPRALNLFGLASLLLLSVTRSRQAV